MSEQSSACRSSLRDEILALTDVQIVPVDVPEWTLSQQLYVKGLTGEEHDAYVEALQRDAIRPKGTTGFVPGAAARLVVAAACDAEGARVFQDGDIPLLRQRSATALNRVAEAAAKLNTAQ